MACGEVVYLKRGKMNFTGKNVLITGATGGLGLEIAKVLASKDLKVWINYRKSKEKAIQIKNQINNNNGKAEIIGFDASNEKEYINAIQYIKSIDGGLFYLVNNAGITKDKLAIRMTADEFMLVVETNLKSTFIGCREALKIMSKQRFGSVVNISSIVGETGNIGQVNYSASKGGIIAMTKSFALEAALRNVRFNSVTPGLIETNMTDVMKQDIKENFLRKIPLKRFSNSKEVANAIVFLLSDEASYITGETLKINGGMYM